MVEQSTILLDRKVIELLKVAREHPRQTYNELLEKMAKTFIKIKEINTLVLMVLTCIFIF